MRSARMHDAPLSQLQARLACPLPLALAQRRTQRARRTPHSGCTGTVQDRVACESLARQLLSAALPVVPAVAACRQWLPA